MTNNDVLRQLRYALNIKDSTMIEIFKLADHEIEQSRLTGLLKREDEEGRGKAKGSRGRRAKAYRPHFKHRSGWEKASPDGIDGYKRYWPESSFDFCS